MHRRGRRGAEGLSLNLPSFTLPGYRIGAKEAVGDVGALRNGKERSDLLL
jgi:hypothetical protein